jgi:asparagine synthase (glutamine-hydrolysing)
MAHSLELRVPFLDHRLVEFATSLPDREKLKGRTTKVALRKAVADWLPPETLAKPKKGFPAPVAAWFRGPMRDTVRESLASQALAGLFRTDTMEALVRQHESGHSDHSRPLFALVLLSRWLDAQARTPAAYALAGT